MPKINKKTLFLFYQMKNIQWMSPEYTVKSCKSVSWSTIQITLLGSPLFRSPQNFLDTSLQNEFKYLFLPILYLTYLFTSMWDKEAFVETSKP
jgi:hypothetical protein